MSDNQKFFETQATHSKVKSEIVSNYFISWAKIMKMRCDKLVYLDLFSGPGYFKDGNKTTPIMVMDQISNDTELLNKVHMHFYEIDKKLCDNLINTVKTHPVYTKIKNEPVINCCEVNRQLIHELPIDDGTFSFIDPYGYNISLDLLNAVVSDWGSDCIFYLSTSGILRNIERDSEQESLIELFGVNGLEKLKTDLNGMRGSFSKHRAMLNMLGNHLIQVKGLYFREFCVQPEGRNAPSHYLVFISKHHRGFAIIKDIMASKSVCDSDGIPEYVWDKLGQPKLPLGDMQKLKDRLMKDFESSTWKVGDFIDKCHQLHYPQIKKNFKDAVLLLEKEELVVCDIPPCKRRKVNGILTLGKKKTITFRRHSCPQNPA